MNIAIIGAGIVGVTTAYELATDRHQVTVFERHGAVAEECSFASAGLISPAQLLLWAAPGMPRKWLRQWGDAHAAMRLGPRLGWHELSWIGQWMRSSRGSRCTESRLHLQQLITYSTSRLHQLRQRHALEFDASTGHLLLLRNAQEHKGLQARLNNLREAGLAFRELNADEARKLEPALNPDSAIEAAIHLPQDEVGNARQFALMIKSEAMRLGVKFEFNSPVSHLSLGSRPALSTRNESTPRTFDAIVLCTGADASTLIKPLGLKIPLVGIHGYSVSANVREPLNAPRSVVSDERHRVSIARLGQRVRVAGGAELGHRQDDKRVSGLRTLYKVLQDWFPGAASMTAGVQEWKGSRPMMPDCLPVLGASGIPGIWLNLGHGDNGWALSCGSARLLADAVAGHAPELDLTACSIARLHR
ncbi:MAG: FAD-dependent oxidoreductase [Curvibacter lanceolatus]|jgi:D-amino-acid dehydrogenase|uniref:FAD-dependent oxidoreductase n=1 Tax=Curvibacter lanceolatus TaxID=86182 RepID=UPI00035F6D6B|nr:FAD-dependent oxidoreductase [Curvibacter lanceolatus]MBV5296389.1 FAD-dependent oxidoreductase [Curvibacter lanceolatus]